MNARRISTVTLLSFTLLIAACDRKRIAEINADPAQYKDKNVTVAGKVVSSFGALGRGIYQIDDGTGRLWVLALRNGVPAGEAYVGVKGQITQGVTFMGRNYGTVLREDERRTENR